MTNKIYTNSGEEILVDDEDYPLLSRYDWQIYGDGYAATKLPIRGGGKYYTMYLHKLVMASFGNVDHIDHNKSDCRKQNLRPATYQENGWNKGKPKNGRHGPPSSQYKGVRRVESKTKGVRWLASLKHVEPGQHKSTGKMVYIGYFPNEIEAARAYNSKVKELRGEWAWVNPLPDAA